MNMNSIQEATVYSFSEDYERIAEAITFLRQNRLMQPDLATVAEHLHLSEYHFQRLFSRWAGISPKRFLQYLTVEYAKSKMAETKSLLDLTLEIGVSSPGRLHDLFVTLEAVSPGEFKTGGAGLKIWYGIHESPFGKFLIATTSRGICGLHFLSGMEEQDAEQVLRSNWQQAEILRDERITQDSSDRIFNPTSLARGKPFVLLVKGTNFQIQVWKALLKVPLGGIATYQTLAEMIDRPTAARAVGNAVGKNPIAFLIPCHRIIRESGELGGYRWGIERKTAMLGWEATRLGGEQAATDRT